MSFISSQVLSSTGIEPRSQPSVQKINPINYLKKRFIPSTEIKTIKFDNFNCILNK